MTAWRQTRWGLYVVVMAALVLLRVSAAFAVISQGDLTVYIYFETREAGRWGEGSSGNNAVPTTFHNIAPGFTTINKLGKPATETGGSFDFNHWDLVEARQLGSVRPDYHFVKNYRLLGRFDTLIVKDAEFFAYYRPWYDAEGTLKDKGRAEAFRDYSPYSQHELQQQYFQNNLHEYYTDLNFTDNFSMRVGKQQIVWSEGNLLSGTDITNPADVSYHGFVGAESAEDTRKGLGMVKLNYILPDFLETANNELEAFVIPGGFECASSLKSNLTTGLTCVNTDPRNPYAVPVSLSGPYGVPLPPKEFSGGLFNQEGQPVRVTSLLDLPAKPMVALLGSGPSGSFRSFVDLVTRDISGAPSNSIDNSEFGMRFSSLLPFGDGLQTSFIFLYEARSPEVGLCTGGCSAPPGFIAEPRAPGLFIGFGKFAYGTPLPGVAKSATALILSTSNYRRNPYFGLTGTYYDKTFTDAVLRYDTLYAPRVSVSAPNGPYDGNFARWTEFSRSVLGVDRPTLVPILYPYLTKQHTLFTLQTTETFYPDLPPGTIPNDPMGKIRRWSTFMSLTATNFLLNGRTANQSGIAWDVDDQTGQIVSSTAYRYTRHVLLGVNLDWYIGRSGRHTDPFLESKSQRINELEFTFSYEL